jgi:hypothetical protein
LVQPAAVGWRAVCLEFSWIGFGVLVDRAGLVEVILAASTILRVESRFDLDLSFHVA